MDNQDHRKNHTTGHENHYICHKCGWPFPNPHPSAKNRRAHKKVCGTLEGYKLTDPDEEQLSNEVYKGTGNSELRELKSNENVKKGIQRRESSRSEEGVYSDAVAEFEDTGTSPAQNTVVNVKGDVIQEPEHPMQGRQLEKPQVLESSVYNLKNNDMQLQNGTSSFVVGTLLASSLDKETEALAVDGREDRHDAASFISDVKPEESVNVIPEITNTKPGDDVADRSLMHSGQSFEGQKNENSDADGHFPHRIASPSIPPCLEVSDLDSRLEQMNEFAGVTTDVSTTGINDSVTIDRLVDSKEEQSSLSGPVTPQIDSSSNSCSGPMVVVGIEHGGTVINGERDASAQEVDIAYPGETVDGHNVKAEPNEKIPAISTSTVIPAESHSNMTIKGCIDHHPVMSDAHDKVIIEMEDQPKNLASEEDHSSFLLSKSDEGDACPGQRVLEENLQQEGTVGKRMGEERLDKFKTDTSECKAAISTGDESNGSEALSRNLTSTCAGRTQFVCSVEKQEPHDSNHDLSQEILPERPTVIHEIGGTARVSTADNEVDRASYGTRCNVCPERATISTGNESNGSEALPDAPSSDITSMHAGLTQIVCSIEKQESHDSHLDLSLEIPPEKPTLIRETGRDAMVSPADAEVDGASDAISSSDFPEMATIISTGNGSNGLEALPDSEIHAEKPTAIPETGRDVVVSPADAKVDRASNAISSSYDFPEKAGTDNSNLAWKYIGEGVVEVHQGEDFLEGPRGLENQAEYVDTNIRVSEALHEDIKVDHDTGGDVSDIHSQSLQDDGDHNLKNQPSASTVVHREFSVISDGRTDHMKEEMVLSNINATNEQAILSDETLLVPNIQAEEADLKRTVAEESTTGLGVDRFYIKSQPLQDKEVPSTKNATDELVILAADTLRTSNAQSQKADLEKTYGEESTAKYFGDDAFEIKSQPLQNGVNDLKKQPSASADVFVDSSSQTDSVEGHWGSASDATFPSTRDANEESAIIATETLATSDTGVKDKDQIANLETKIGTSERPRSCQSDIFDAPSFMTLVEPVRGNDQLTASSEIQTVQNPQQSNSSHFQAGWFPSLTHDVKESEGRKKNKEIIAKVSNWSAGKPHTPLRNLLVEANLESKQKPPNKQEHPATVAPKHEASAQDNNVAAKTSPPPVMVPEASTALAAKGDQEKEWNTPARLPESKKEKRKARGIWVPFVCCTAVDMDP